jgi:hypothetical protein
MKNKRYRILEEIRSNDPISQEAIYEEARRVRARQSRIVIPMPNFLQNYQANGIFAANQPVELYVNENSRNEENRQEIKHKLAKPAGLPLSPVSLAQLRGKFRETENKLDEVSNDKTSSESNSDNGLYISDTSSESSLGL